MKISLSQIGGEELVQITNQGNLWKIVPGRWWLGRNEADAYSPKEDVLLDRNDISQLAREMRRLIKEKSISPTGLSLTFRQNKAQLKIFMHFMQSADKFYEEKFKDTFCFKIGIDINESIIGIDEYPKDPGDYPYSETVSIDGSLFRFLKEYYTAEELEKFVEELEKA